MPLSSNECVREAEDPAYYIYLTEAPSSVAIFRKRPSPCSPTDDTKQSDLPSLATVHSGSTSGLSPTMAVFNIPPQHLAISTVYSCLFYYISGRPGGLLK